MQQEKTLATAAAKAGMDEKTARKYRNSGQLPTQMKPEHHWRTRKDPFEGVWEEVQAWLEVNAGLEAKTLFEDLQRRFPGRYPDGQLRTLQRRVKAWRALEGPPKEVFFPQVHKPGELCESDFTRMGSLGVTIQGQPFDHMFYHFVLTYSNWETGTVCFSESFESLSEGFQNALWELGGVPGAHRTDRLSTAVHKTDHPETFTRRYSALLRHYGLEGRRIQAACPNENGDVEQRHYRFKKAVEQALILRGSPDFADREAYGLFLNKLLRQLNAGRQDRLGEELKVLGRLPLRRLEASKRLRVKVGSGSTIRVNHNVYSVDSRLIRETVEVRLYAEHLEVWYGQRQVEKIPRLLGSSKHRIQYRHIIDWLVRKPGAFENYRYREDLFPTHRFRMAYDELKRTSPCRAAKEYLGILYLAARESEAEVDHILQTLLDREIPLSAAVVKQQLQAAEQPPRVTEINIADVELASYDALLSSPEVSP
ncbi:MAG: IS21 family transposase [Spirochaetia bacterium]